MSKLSEPHICGESGDFFKLPGSKVDIKGVHGTKEVLSGSCGDLSKVSLKHSQSILSRDDSVSSKSSFTSIFPSLMKSFDYSSGFNINQSFVPRPEKTLHLFEIILSTLKALHKKYSLLTCVSEGPGECLEGQICSKVDKRIILLETMKNEYESMLDEKEAELKRIESTISSLLVSKNVKEEQDLLDCETYWSICREMCLSELKLERCCGKLQFQIMNLDSITRVNPLDQYELSIRLNDVSKFKTRIKIEKGGHQVWENTTFILTPSVDDSLDIKFCELKTLNKALVLLEKKMPSINKLIRADPSIFTFWLTPVGTIKLKVIVQWNALLDDPDLITSLSQLDNKYANIPVVRTRANSASNKYSQNRLSVNFGHLFRSDASEKISPRGSMENIAENVEEDEIQKVNLRRKVLDRKSDKTKAKYNEDFIVDNTYLERRTSDPNTLSTKSLSNDQKDKIKMLPKIITDETTEMQEETINVSRFEVKENIETVVKEAPVYFMSPELNKEEEENVENQETDDNCSNIPDNTIKDGESDVTPVILKKDLDAEGEHSILNIIEEAPIHSENYGRKTDSKDNEERKEIESTDLLNNVLLTSEDIKQDDPRNESEAEQDLKTDVEDDLMKNNYVLSACKEEDHVKIRLEEEESDEANEMIIKAEEMNDKGDSSDQSKSELGTEGVIKHYDEDSLMTDNKNEASTCSEGPCSHSTVAEEQLNLLSSDELLKCSVNEDPATLF